MEGWGVERWRGGDCGSLCDVFFCLKRSRGQHNCEINLKEALGGGSAKQEEAEWKRWSSNQPFSHSSGTVETGGVRSNGARTAETLAGRGGSENKRPGVNMKHSPGVARLRSRSFLLFAHILALFFFFLCFCGRMTNTSSSAFREAEG